MNELSIEDLRKGLLAHGMFADKLPSFLTTEHFYNYCSQKGFSLNYTSKMGWDYIRYDSMRNTNVPRALGIPTPFAYYNLCTCIVDNWENIKQHFQDKTFSENFKRSQIHIQKRANGAHLFEMSANYKDVDGDTIEVIQKQPIGNLYKVETDISSCFPSIYSHALPWALVGKEDAKSKKDNIHWYNQLDKCSRHLKYNETCGLLIGPHTSNLLSEIILTSVDAELSDYNYVRHIDDITYYAKSEDDAELFIRKLSSELKKYELLLNTKKTHITRIPLPVGEDWINSLNSFYIEKEYTTDGKQIFRYARLKAYIDLAITLAKSTGNSSVYTYMLKVVSNYYLGKKSLSYYIDVMHHLLLTYPYLVHWFDEYIFDRFNINKDKIKEIAMQLYNVGIKKRNYEAASFSIYWSIKYNFDLDKIDLVQKAIDSEDCILLLLTYIRNKHIKEDKRKLQEEAKKYLHKDMDRYWLFVYEVLPLSELKGDYKTLKRNKITFIK